MDRSFLDLRIERGKNDTWHLKQDAGPCDDTSEHWVILEPEHLDTLARAAGFVPANEIPRACERLQDRLNLLAALVAAHTKPGDPLRAAVACLLGDQATNLVADGTTNLVASTVLVAGESNQIDCRAPLATKTPDSEQFDLI